MLRQEQFIKSQLALAAWREGNKYGGHRCMLAVAHVLANRAKGGWGSWLNVIERIPAFSANNEDEQPPAAFPDLFDPNVVNLLRDIDGIYDGTAQDLSGGGYYWADLSNVTRDWFKVNIVGSPAEHPRVGSCFPLTFWK